MTTTETTFAVSGQHYLFNVQTFAHTVLALGGDSFAYALRDRTTQGVIDDVASGAAELGVIMQTSETESALNEALAEAGLAFHELAVSAPLVALPSSHPFVNAKSLTLEQLARTRPLPSTRRRSRRCRAPRRWPAPTARRSPSSSWPSTATR